MLALAPAGGARLGIAAAALTEEGTENARVSPKGIEASGGGVGKNSAAGIEAMGGSIPCCS